MIDDMTMRNLSPSTHETYIRAVAQFSAFHRRSPDKLGVEHLREYHLHLVSRGLTANSICVKTSALRFFYGTTLRRLDIAGQIPMPAGRIICRRYSRARRSSICSMRYPISSCAQPSLRSTRRSHLAGRPDLMHPRTLTRDLSRDVDWRRWVKLSFTATSVAAPIDAVRKMATPVRRPSRRLDSRNHFMSVSQAFCHRNRRPDRLCLYDGCGWDGFVSRHRDGTANYRRDD
jgi:hypothetical protein